MKYKTILLPKWGMPYHVKLHGISQQFLSDSPGIDLEFMGKDAIAETSRQSNSFFHLISLI